MLAAIVAAAAAWVSFGAIGFDVPGGARIGILPRDPWHLIAVVLVALVVTALGIRKGSGRGVAIAVSPLLLLFLPWLPFQVPAALLVWAGGSESLLWLATAIALAIVASSDAYIPVSLTPRTHARGVAALSVVVFSLAAWRASPAIPAGDEPHYLVITQSLLRDGDLRIENNHRRGDYREYFAGDLRPDVIRPGRNGAIYSIHAPGLPALVLPAFAVAGYPGVIVFLIAVSAAASGLVWWLAWTVTRSISAAWFGWAAVALSAPYLLHTFTVYPDGIGAVLVLTGFSALPRAEWDREQQQMSWRPWLLHGVALAMLPWIHTRFAVLAATLGGLVLLRLSAAPNAVIKAIAFLMAPALSAVSWLSFFVLLYGTPDPSAPYGGQVQNSFAFLPNGFGGLLFDQGFGLLATAPVLILGFVGFARLHRFAAQWLIVATPYLLTVTTFAMWWAGWSAPARFFVPMLLPLAVPAASAWTMMRSRGLRAAALALLATGAWISVVLAVADGGRLGFHARNPGGMTAAPWLDWAATSVALPAAMPAFVPLPVGSGSAARAAAARAGFVALLPWLACGGAAAYALHRLAQRRLRQRVELVAATTLIFAVAGTVAVAAGWQLQRVDALAPTRGQIDVLQAIGRRHDIGIDLVARRRLTTSEIISRMRIEAPVSPAVRGGSAASVPLMTLSGVPAGEYRLLVRGRGTEGWVMAGIGVDRDPFAVLTQPLSAVVSGSDVRLPVDVRTFVVRGDEDACRHVNAVVLQPLRILHRDEKPVSGYARQAARYPGAIAFFMDDRVFPEPGAFWIGGGRESEIALLPDQSTSSQALILRNGPVDNVVTISSGAWRDVLMMASGEERRVEVPIDSTRVGVAVRIHSASGFCPSALDQSSHDTRVLGVYVTVP